MKSRTPSENRPSILLTREENELIFKLVGTRCQSLATAVVQLFTTEGPAHNQWFKRDTGILCLIKDNPKRSYYFRVFCMQRKSCIWEHEVYNQIEYKSPRVFLHTFEAEEYMVAFNFANEEEASILLNSLLQKIEQKRRSREDRRHRSSLQSTARLSSDVTNVNVQNNNVVPAVPQNHHIAPTSNIIRPPLTNTNLYNGISSSPQQKINTSYKSSAAAKRNKSRKLTKADIGLPHDFKHVSHVGWDANKGFDVENLPEKDMKDFFYRAGVSDSQLEDKETRDFIYDFIITHGGADAVKKALVGEETIAKLANNAKNNQAGFPRQMPPPVPLRNTTPPIPPAPVIKEVNGSRHAPPPPSRAPPPPPPPPQRQLPPPPQVDAQAPPPPPPGPPPPPAPPPLVLPTGPPAPPMAPQGPDTHTALMESIRGGKALKHVEVDQKRGNLLSEIRQGIELRSVAVNSNESDRKSTTQNGLAGALARALEERSKAIHSDSSNSDDDDTASDGDEWED